MRRYTETDDLVSLVIDNYKILPVLNRFEFIPGFQQLTIKEACENKGINLEFFLVVINTFNDEGYFPEEQLMKFSPLLIINYLRKTHKYYIDKVLPKLDSILEQIIVNCGKDCREIYLINAFYKKYKTELLIHIKEEEEKTFPYIINLIDNNEPNTYSIHQFEDEHTNVDEKLNDLIQLILRHNKAQLDADLINEFVMNLFRFEKDIKNHARIEDKILIPQVLKLEKN